MDLVDNIIDELKKFKEDTAYKSLNSVIDRAIQVFEEYKQEQKQKPFIPDKDEESKTPPSAA